MLDVYYSWYSICSEKVLICLFEKGLTFKGHMIDLFTFDQTRPDYVAINPLGVVPTLVVDGVPIQESTVINEYLDEAFPTPRLSPQDPMRRARMRLWVQRFQDQVFPAAGMLSQPAFIVGEFRRRWTDDQLRELIARKIQPERIARQLKAVTSGFPPEELALAEQRIVAALDAMELELADGREWIMGAYSLADIAAAPNVHRMVLIDREDMLAARPNVAAWYRRMSERPGFRDCYAFAPSPAVKRAAA